MSTTVKITAAEVNKLRQATGAGMMDCKKALVEAEGDFDKAIAVLRKKGQKVAEKRADRDSSEGAAVAKINAEQTEGVAIVLGCETDFVGKNENFLALATKVDNADVLVKDVAMQVASMGATSLSYKDFDPAFVASETEARIAVIEKDNIELGRLGKTLKNVPKYISMAQLTPEVITEAEEAAKAELKAEGKPEQIWDRILPGKMERFVSDNTTLDQEQCLLDQKFIKDEKKTVAAYVSSYGEVEIAGFNRATVGQ